ncbi:MAG: hypothetical protein QXF76_00160 [Candidatus Anstonellales archaeon]
MRNLFTLTLIVLISIFVIGCTNQSSEISDNKTKEEFHDQTLNLKEKANDYLNLAGVKNAYVFDDNSDTIYVNYITENLTYEYEIINDWGKIFGVVSQLYKNKKKITINQFYMNDTVFLVTANISDIKAFNSGQMNLSEFKKRLGIKSKLII